MKPVAKWDGRDRVEIVMDLSTAQALAICIIGEKELDLRQLADELTAVVPHPDLDLEEGDPR